MSVKFNNETGMDPHLQEAIQEKLAFLNHNARSWQTKQVCLASLNGIATALHALMGEVWTCECWPEGYVFVNEMESECIRTEL